jgi:uncharacterized protein (TIGR03437 family)
LAQVTLNQAPSRIVGHPNPEQLSVVSANPNLVEGRELYEPEGIALDTSVTPPIVYVADTLNNRVLAWKNGTGFNNGQAADLIIGQPDRFSTQPLGPGTIFSATGLSFPTGLAVYQGDLYVADTGNNRVLRFRKPFAQASQPPVPDLYIGQPNLSSRGINYNGSAGLPSAQGIFLSDNNNTFQSGIAFDGSGNLWMSDPGNRRVLRFKAADVAAGGGGLTADLELGQTDFTSLQPGLNTGVATSLVTLNQFAVPSAIAFDGKGRLYVTDSDPGNPVRFSRVLVFTAPFTSDQTAARAMSVFPPNQKPTSQSQIDATVMFDPEGIFFFSAGMGVVDRLSNRILIFDAYESWPDPNTQFSPQARAVIGQNFTFSNRNANNASGQTFFPPPSNTTLSGPVAVAFSGTELFVADAFNNRVLVMPLSGTTFGPATRVLGQDAFNTFAPNLIEGREFDFVKQTGTGLAADAAIAIDNSGDTPHLYVADPYNNRVLGFKDLRTLAAGKYADVVIGQPTMATSVCNYPTGDPTKPTQSSLCLPMGLLVDGKGNLYVTDSGNGRVLRFPAPFSQQGPLQQADLVLGQQNFTTVITDPSAINMASPYGLAFTANGLVVSDSADNRVLYFPFTANGTFTAGTDNGLAATKVFGQTKFTSVTAGSTSTTLSAPHHLAADTDSHIYVVDSINGRVQIFADPNSAGTPTGASAIYSITQLNQPRGIYVSSITGEIWVTNSGGANCLRYPKYVSLLLNGSPTATIPAASVTLAVAQDQYGDLFVADGTNRIAIYYQGLAFQNAANFLARPLAPGMVASVYPAPNTTAQFAASTAVSDLPLATTLADTQVRFNGLPAPLYFVATGQINFYVPMGAPTSGTAEVEVVRPSTGQVLAASQVQMSTGSPGVFLYPQGQTGPLRTAAVINSQDNTINSTTNPVLRGQVVSIYATGQGLVPNAPPDGVPAPTDGTVLNTPTLPNVVIGTCDVDDKSCNGGETDEHVLFSGLAPGLVGVWQINVKIPMGVPPGTQTLLGIIMNGLFSIDPSQYRTTIAVK